MAWCLILDGINIDLLFLWLSSKCSKCDIHTTAAISIYFHHRVFHLYIYIPHTPRKEAQSWSLKRSTNRTWKIAAFIMLFRSTIWQLSSESSVEYGKLVLWQILVLVLTCSICIVQAHIYRSKNRCWKYLLQQYTTRASQNLQVDMISMHDMLEMVWSSCSQRQWAWKQSIWVPNWRWRISVGPLSGIVHHYSPWLNTDWLGFV